MKQPEPEPRDCIVIVRVSQVEEAENLLIDEVEPQKSRDIRPDRCEAKERNKVDFEL